MSKPSEQNPYEAPVAGAVKRSALPMPATVKATVAVAAVAAVLSTAGQVLLAVTGGLDEKGAATLAGNVVVWALILIGLVKAHRLAWQWGRLVGGLMVLFALVQTAAAPAAVVFVPLYLAIVVLLST